MATARRRAGDSEQPAGSARSADRALDILELLSGREEGLTLSEIAHQLAIPPSSLHAILRVLLARRYVVLGEAKRRYRLGHRVLDLGAGYLGGTGLYAEARRQMRELAERTGETVQVAVLDGGHVLYLDAVDGRHPVRMITPLGERIPAHATAAGKALLSLLPDEEIEALCQGPLHAYTWRTATGLPDLRREIEVTRRLGIARDSEEYVEGLSCLAMAVTDRFGHAAAVSVSLPTTRMTPERGIELARLLQSYAPPGPEGQAGRAGRSRRKHATRVAWSMSSMAVQAYEEMYRAARLAAQAAGVDLIWTNARDDIARQAADVDRLLALQPDVLLIHPADAARSDLLFLQAGRAGVPVLCFQRPARAAYDAFIGADTYAVGRMQVDFVAARLGGRGKLVVIEGDPYNDNARNIARGVLDAVARYPHLEVLVDQPAGHWSPETARLIALDAWRRHGPAIDAVVVANDAMAGGAAAALEELGAAGSVLLVGADGDEAALRRMELGIQHGTAFQNPADLAEAALRFALQAATGSLAATTLPSRSVFHNPPGPDVRIREVPYLFVGGDNLAILRRYWSAAQAPPSESAAG